MDGSRIQGYEYFELEKETPSLRKSFIVYTLCSGNLISVGVTEKSPGDRNKFGGRIYQDGFSSKVLKSAVETIDEKCGRFSSYS